MWASFLIVTLCSISALCAIASALSAARSRKVAQSAQALAESVVREPTSLKSAVQSLADSLAETQDALTVTTNRVKMMRVRSAANHTRDEPPIDKAATKEELRRRAGLVAGQPAPHK